MNLKRHGRVIAVAMPCMVFVLTICAVLAQSAKGPRETENSNLWSHDNLFAWCVVPFDAKKRGPEARAAMLERLGFKQFAYDWRSKNIPTFDAEIVALQRHNIHLLAWWFPLEADNPTAKLILEVFKRHNVHPQLWVMLPRVGMPKTPEGQERRVIQDADQIKALVELAAPYRCRIELYNHNGWFGIEKNQLAIINRLKQIGVTRVGMVYNFSHAHDALHDDTVNFPSLWRKIEPYVVAVNITGIGPRGQEVYPSQGDHDLEMMRTIQQSGWRGPVGLIAEKGGDAEVTLKKYLLGLDWIAAELRKPGSGGPCPFPPVRR
jgi:sugar phosphate isomerase/epimerase